MLTVMTDKIPRFDGPHAGGLSATFGGGGPALLTPTPTRGSWCSVKRESMSGWRLPGHVPVGGGDAGRRGVRRSPADPAGVGRRPAPTAGVRRSEARRSGWVLLRRAWAVDVPTAWPHGLRPARLVPVGSLRRLVYDHRLIIDSAVEHIRSRYEANPTRPAAGETFTVLGAAQAAMRRSPASRWTVTCSAAR